MALQEVIGPPVIRCCSSGTQRASSRKLLAVAPSVPTSRRSTTELLEEAPDALDAWLTTTTDACGLTTARLLPAETLPGASSAETTVASLVASAGGKRRLAPRPQERRSARMLAALCASANASRSPKKHGGELAPRSHSTTKQRSGGSSTGTSMRTRPTATSRRQKVAAVRPQKVRAPLGFVMNRPVGIPLSSSSKSPHKMSCVPTSSGKSQMMIPS